MTSLPRPPHRRGVALMSVLVLIAVLAGIVVEMTRRLGTARRTTQRLAARLQIDRLQSDLQARPDLKPPEELTLPGGNAIAIDDVRIELRSLAGTVLARRSLLPNDTTPPSQPEPPE